MLNPNNKTFTVMGVTIEVLVSSDETGGTLCTLMQTTPPGGGPPPHVHDKEDETFTAMSGEFEVFDGRQWKKLALGESFFAERGKVHAFRNSGTANGDLLCTATPGGLDKYLEAISPLAVPQDMGRLLEISGAQGIAFVMPGQPENVAA